MEIAQTYLGNVQENPEIEQQIKSTQKPYLETYLSLEDRRKGRIQAQSTCGLLLGIIKSRDWSMRSGDVFVTESGSFLLIHLQKQKLMVLSFSETVKAKAAELVYLGHVLGNHHYPLIIDQDKLYLQLGDDSEVILQTIKTLQIPGLQITYESRSPEKSLSFSHHHH